MYIVSTTFVVEPKIHAQWYALFVDKFLSTLPLSDVVFTRVMSEHSNGQYTYSLQVSVVDMASYGHFVSDTLGEFVGFSAQIFGENVLHFTTLLKRIAV